MSISLLVKKFIAGIIALLMPITSSIAARQPQQPIQNKTDFHTAEVAPMPLSDGDFAVEEDPADDPALEQEQNNEPAEETEPPAPVEETETPAPEVPAEETPEVPAETPQENAPVAEWDISDTDEDDVHMYYYDEDDTSFLDTITASVKAIFLPITAYADTNVTEYSDKEREISDDRYENGTVVIDGDGATQEMLFLRWLNPVKFLTAYGEWVSEKNYYNDAYILRAYVDNATGNFTGPAIHIDELYEMYIDLPEDEAGEAILKEYIPTHIAEFVMVNPNFWQECADFIPQHIIINGNVTDISFLAFGFCTQIEDVTINANVEKIQAGAFTRTNITEITLPETVKEIGSGVFVECLNLKNIYLKGAVENYASDAFASLPMDSNVICEDYTAYARLAGLDPEEPMQLADGETQITAKYNRRTKLTFIVPEQTVVAASNNAV